MCCCGRARYGVAPWEGAVDLFRDTMRGGIPTLEFGELLTQTFAGEGLVEDLTKMALTEPADGLYWQDKAARLEDIDVPAYVVASYDNPLHTHGTFDAFRRIASHDKWLRAHNTQEWPDFYTHSDELLTFFDRYLKGVDNGWEHTPRVRISVLDPGGEDEVNREVAAWPPPGYEHRRLHLTQDGALSHVPDAREGEIRYSAEPGSSARFRVRFDSDVELVGYSKLRVWAQTDGAEDLDLMVVLHKVDGEGNPINRDQGNGASQPLFATGLQRASRRALDPVRSTDAAPRLLLTAPQRLLPGEAVPLDIAIWPTGLRIHSGESLEVLVMPYHPMPTGLPFGTARIALPVDRFTFQEGDDVEMRTLGGGPDTRPAWVAAQAQRAEPVNKGEHTLHMGGRFDSHLLVPLRSVQGADDSTCDHGGTAQ